MPTLYLSQSGNDSNSGTQSAPLKTLKAAHDKAVDKTATDILLKRGESFSESPFGWYKSGASLNGLLRIDAWGDPALPKPVINFKSSQGHIFSGIYHPVGVPFFITDVAFRNLAFKFPEHTVAKIKEAYALYLAKSQQWHVFYAVCHMQLAIRLNVKRLFVENCEFYNSGMMFSGLYNNNIVGNWERATDINISNNLIREVFGHYDSLSGNVSESNICGITLFATDGANLLNNRFIDNGFQMDWTGVRHNETHWSNGDYYIDEESRNVNIVNIAGSFD